MPGPLELEPLDETLRAAVIEQVEIRRAALRGSVYPCADCQPAAFHRWAGGHLEPRHDRAGCPECSELDRPRKPGTRDLVRDGPSPVPLPPVDRRDLF